MKTKQNKKLLLSTMLCGFYSKSAFGRMWRGEKVCSNGRWLPDSLIFQEVLKLLKGAVWRPRTLLCGFKMLFVWAVQIEPLDTERSMLFPLRERINRHITSAGGSSGRREACVQSSTGLPFNRHQHPAGCTFCLWNVQRCVENLADCGILL